ncbi:DUF4998 domain-containing protein [Algibacter miyuki]|uniref:DUF4998 domain-containing protein n=1 Tax=Algibacter miyuki TaxID=1306933 RepID=A0ABV5H075_9FLAO|nr:DUF4998 domain-containing protein [Algibacter miyuki]MDN3667556.1 DUF4998 domain-containing protein [Algibacter miyuki]
MMKKIRKSIALLLLVCITAGIYSCTSDKEYLDFTKGGEISYTAAIDSLKIAPGKNRVALKGLIIGDPKVSEARVYWNNNTDSVVVAVNRTAGIDVISTIIDNLEENVYNFVVKTFDADGNSSIPVSLSAEVYGDRYVESLFNRPIISNLLLDSNLTINFADMNLSSGVIGSEVEYMTTNGTLNTVFINIADSSLNITDFESGSTYNYRTTFKPSEESIDIFYSAYKSVKPIPTPILGNASVPFLAEETDGRWGNLAAPWITNDAAKNHNGFGGWDEWNGNLFNLESGWGAPAITNGKIYQVVTAEPATYQLKIIMFSGNPTNFSLEDEGGSYFVVAQGNMGLPNVEDVSTSPEVLVSKRILATSSVDYVLEFTITETTEISIGEITTQSDAGRYANISSWEILVINP